MKIGILGAGNIARHVAPALVACPELECWAVASRDPEKARAFGAEFGFQRTYGSYEALVEDPQVELIYVATPHSLHYDHMMLCLSHGKPVLCEKAFTANAQQARTIRDYAAEKKLFAAEAIWPRYMPSRQIINSVLEKGLIGTPNTLTANLSYPISQVPRIYRPDLAGGALLDIGVYGLNFALMHFGSRISRMESAVQLTSTGVDAMETVTLFYENGTMAVLTHSIYARSDRKGMIHGSDGYMVIENINNPSSLSVYDTQDRLLARYDMPPQINGYEYEFLEAAQALSQGLTEAPSMPLADSIHMMECMDSLRRAWGVRYPSDPWD